MVFDGGVTLLFSNLSRFYVPTQRSIAADMVATAMTKNLLNRDKKRSKFRFAKRVPSTGSLHYSQLITSPALIFNGKTDQLSSSRTPSCLKLNNECKTKKPTVITRNLKITDNF